MTQESRDQPAESGDRKQLIRDVQCELLADIISSEPASHSAPDKSNVPSGFGHSTMP
jgi:hypothetical protein